MDAVIFDMDGTLVDSEKMLKPLMESLFADHNIVIAENEHGTFVGKPLHVTWKYLKEKHGLKYSVEELVQSNTERFKQWMGEGMGFELMPGIEDLISRLEEKGILMGVSTSAPREIMDKILNHFDLRRRFLGLSSAEDVVNGKPAPDIFLRTAKLLDVDPAKCIVFEDSTHGITGAKAAGMQCLGYSNFGKNRQDISGADIEVDCYTKLSVEDFV